MFSRSPPIRTAAPAPEAAQSPEPKPEETDTLTRLREAQRRYEMRFGYIFITCASGRSASEIMGELEVRLHNDHHTELRTAAEEQRRITRLRLEKLVGPDEESGA